MNITCIPGGQYCTDVRSKDSRSPAAKLVTPCSVAKTRTRSQLCATWIVVFFQTARTRFRVSLESLGTSYVPSAAWLEPPPLLRLSLLALKRPPISCHFQKLGGLSRIAWNAGSCCNSKLRSSQKREEAAAASSARLLHSCWLHSCSANELYHTQQYFACLTVTS